MSQVPQNLDQYQLITSLIPTHFLSVFRDDLASKDLAMLSLFGSAKVASTFSTLVIRVTKKAGHLSTLSRKYVEISQTGFSSFLP